MRGNWATWLIAHALYPLALIGAPLFLGGLVIYFVVTAFQQDLESGLRSLGAAVIPLIILVVVAQAQAGEEPPLLVNLPPVIAFAFMFMIGVSVMPLLTLSATVPVAEFVLSSAFSVIILAVALERTHAVFYCAGAVIGALSYIALFGVPVEEIRQRGKVEVQNVPRIAPLDDRGVEVVP